MWGGNEKVDRWFNTRCGSRRVHGSSRKGVELFVGFAIGANLLGLKNPKMLHLRLRFWSGMRRILGNGTGVATVWRVYGQN